MERVPASADTHSQLNPGGLVVSVSPSIVDVGETLQVSGFHFPPNIGVSGQVCGNDDLSGSDDCVLDNTGIATVASDGRFTMSMSVSVPPVPCPCVAAISSTALSTTPSSPINILGAPIGPLQPPTSASTVNQPLKIVNAQLSGNGPWYAWFGGMAHRTLSLTVHNPNRGIYPHPSLVLVAGKSGSALSTVSTSPLPSIGPGRTVTVHVNVVFPAFSFGKNEVRGAVGDAALQEHMQVTTTIVPWGLIVIALIILQFIFLSIRNAARRRNERRQSDPPPAEVDGPITPTGDVPTVSASEKVPDEVGAV